MKLILLLSFMLIAAVAVSQPQLSFAKKHHSDDSDKSTADSSGSGTSTTSGDTFADGLR
jgi:hypothetical protein